MCGKGIFSRLLLVLLFSRKIMQIECYAEAPITDGRTEGCKKILRFSSDASVRLLGVVLRFCRHMLHQLIYSSIFPLHYRYSYISDIIYKNLIIVWECQNSRLSESAVSWTLHFTPKGILWYLREANFFLLWIPETNYLTN